MSETPATSEIQSLKDIFSKLSDDQKREFLGWAAPSQPQPAASAPAAAPKAAAKKGGAKKKAKPNADIIRREKQLEDIIDYLKFSLPLSALSPDEEKAAIPDSAVAEGFTKENTLHVDQFLYSEDDVDELVEEGKLQRHVCGKCGSRDIQNLNYISHSLSKEVLKWIFGAVLGNLNGKTVVDVGSRLGSVLYVGWLFAAAEKLIGVEVNKYFSDIQSQTVAKYKMNDRVQIINADICTQTELLSKADVVILHNVFEWFVDKEKMLEVWEKVLGSITKKGALILTCPSIEDSAKAAGIQLDWKKRLHKMPIQYPKPTPNEEGDEFFDDVLEIHLYKVL